MKIFKRGDTFPVLIRYRRESFSKGVARGGGYISQPRDPLCNEWDPKETYDEEYGACVPASEFTSGDRVTFAAHVGFDMTRLGFRETISLICRGDHWEIGKDLNSEAFGFADTVTRNKYFTEWVEKYRPFGRRKK